MSGVPGEVPRERVVAEEAANREYMRLLEGRSFDTAGIAVSRSSQWLGTGLPHPRDIPVGPVVGRVALDSVDPDIGQADFYIGPWHKKSGSLVVFSWAAPVAETFFHPDGTQHDLCDRVVVTRTMTLRDRQIVGYVDDQVREGALSDPFAPRRPLSVPAAPPPATPTSTEQTTVSSEQTTALEPPPVAPTPGAVDAVAVAAQVVPAKAADARTWPTSPDALSPAQPPTVPVARVKTVTTAPLRAEAAVRDAIGSPRSERLTTTLATLQPDQYDLVTRPASIPMVLQGNPGTGKTVIAAHRAAYLVHPSRGNERLKRVLLVGPTTRYSDHVRGIIADLAAPKSVRVEGLSDMLQVLRNVGTKPKGLTDGHYLDCDSEIAGMADFAADQLTSTQPSFLRQAPEDRSRKVYECVRTNRAGGEQIAYDPDLIQRLQGLPSFDSAAQQRRFVPILAMCALSAKVWKNPWFDHIVVDEAQDVRPLEWRILDRINTGGGWTILGDIYQRRSDYSHRDWQVLINELDLSDAGTPIKPTTCRRGYRSTKTIMHFANQLLPAEGRRTESLQADGPAVTIKKTTERTIGEEATRQASRLCSTYPTGTVAIIAPVPDIVSAYLRAHDWKRDYGSSQHWVNGDHRVALLGSEDSRGLEFDGVVVVEPSSFPPNLGIRGQLYTSLTRANRELAVVHSKGLPDKMRAQ